MNNPVIKKTKIARFKKPITFKNLLYFHHGDIIIQENENVKPDFQKNEICLFYVRQFFLKIFLYKLIRG